MCVCACGWVGGWGGCSCVICVFISVRKSCHFTTVFLVGRYFYLFTSLSLELWIFFFFFQSGPHFSIRGGEQRGLDPLPPGFNPKPPPIFFLPTPPPVFSLFFFQVPPPKIKILGDCSCVICVFFYVRKSCHFTTVFLVGRYFYLHVFTLSLGLCIFFFQSGPHFSIRGGEQRGLDPLPAGFNPLPPPILFLPTPPPPLFFPYFSSRYPAQN